MRVDRLVNALAPKLWRIGGSVVAVGMLGFGTTQVVERLAHEEATIVSRYDASDLRSVDVGNADGPMHIVGTDDDTVRIRAQVSHGLRATGHSARIDGDRLVVRGTCPIFLSSFCEVDYDIAIPRDLAVSLRTGEDRATVRGVTGDIDASTGNGTVEVAGADGELRLHTGNGRAVGTDLASPVVEADTGNGSVELTFAESPRAVDAKSGNGSVEIVLPDTPVSYRVDESSGNGTVDTSIRTDPDSDRTITAETGNGNITIRYPSG